MINTKFTYLYRDASNYKRNKTVVVRGNLVLEELQPHLEDGERFIPGQVDLPYPQLEWSGDHYAFPTEDDHVWCEVIPDGFEETTDEPTLDSTAEELLIKFQAAKQVGWDVSEASEALGL